MNRALAIDSPGFNPTNVKIVCRIRPPKSFETQKEYKKLSSTQLSSPSHQSQYTSVRNRSRSNSKDFASPFRHQASLRQTLRDNSGKRSSSKGSQGRNSGAPSSKAGSFSGINTLGCVQNDKKYCVFTTKERSNLVVASENAVPGKLINESLADVQDLKYFNNTLLGQSQSFSFNFDSVFNESHKQEKFYASVVRPVVRSFVEGENACIALFGPSEGGKTFTLKGKTGMDRGILPRAVEDMFNIVRNSEDRDEDYEMLKNELNSSQSDSYSEKDHSNFNFNQAGPNVRDNLRQEQVPERLFLKVSVYQIFVDKVLDLLTQTSATRQRVQIDHYIDKESEEVVSKLTNITEKVVFTLEDFYSVLQEAFKNRRIESVSMQEQELRKKSHFIIGLTLMKRSQNKKLSEVSRLNFVELSGSEQAVAEEKFYQDSSIRQFVTKSFNSLSSQLLKAALKKKSSVSTNMIDDGESKLINCLRNTLTSTSNALLICCVNPGQSFYDHSLPALKFCARIRDCIVKKSNKQSLNKRGPPSISSQSEDIQYNIDTVPERGASHITRDQLELIKKEFSQRQQSIMLGEYADRFELDRWKIDRIETVDKIINKLKNSPSQDRQILVMIDDILFLRDKISKLFNNMTTPRENPHSSQQIFNTTHRSNMPPTGQDQYSQGSFYNPQFSQTQTTNHHMNSDYKMQSSSGAYDLQFNSLSKQRSNINIQNQDPDIDNYNYSHNHQIGEQSRFNTAQTPNFDYQSHSSQYIPTKESSQLKQTMLRPHQPVLSPRHQSYSSGFMQTQSQRSLPNQESSGIQKQSYQSHFNAPTLEIETSIDDSSQPMKSRNNHIQIYKSYDGQNLESPKNNIGYNSQNRQISIIQQRPSVSNNTQAAAIKEIEFLDTAHPQLEVSQRGQSNNLSRENLLSQSPRSSPKQQQQQQQQQQYRPAPSSQSRSMAKSAGNGLQVDNSTSKISGVNSTSQIRARNVTSNKSSLLNMSNKISNMQNESVYQNDQEAIQDINRLIKLNDVEGVRLRVMQIYKEKSDQDKLLREIDKDIDSLREELETKDKLLEEYEFVIEKSQQQYQHTLDDLHLQKDEMETELNAKVNTMQDDFNQMKEKLKEVQAENEMLLKEKELSNVENKTMERQKCDAEERYGKEKETNEKLRSNYEILKEHELSIIKDYEGKKSKEIAFYELTQTELHNQLKEEQLRSKDLEEEMFRLKEDLRRIDFDYQKSMEDRKHMGEHIEKIENKLEQEEESRQDLCKTLQESEREYQRLDQEKYKLSEDHQKTLGQIDKLHMLIEEMEKTIQSEQQKRGEERFFREQKEKEVETIQSQIKTMDELMQSKEKQVEDLNAKEIELQKQVSTIVKMNEDTDKQLILMKAKEYDKVDLMRRCAELEARIKYLQVDNENLVKERNKLDIANVELNRDKMGIQQNTIEIESELEYFRKSHEDHLDRFDQKFDAITTELTKLKNENIQLKEKEKSMKRSGREIEEERDEWREKCKQSERKNEEVTYKLYELEREVRSMMTEREKEMKDSALRSTFETRQNQEEKGKMLDDIHSLIKQFKDDKKMSSKTHIPAINSINSMHNSSYY